MTEDIKGFEGQYAFLSNFSFDGFDFTGYRWYTNEHFFQAMKTNVSEEIAEIAAVNYPGQAKKLGRKVHLRSDWEDIKVDVMRLGLSLKFKDPDVRSKLIATGDAYLEETNVWGDTYWGVCKGKGLNMLGILLMRLRDEITF